MVMKLEKVLKFKGIGHRESGIGNWRKFFTYHLCPMPDALDCFELPFVYGLSEQFSAFFRLVEGRGLV